MDFITSAALATATQEAVDFIVSSLGYAPSDETRNVALSLTDSEGKVDKVELMEALEGFPWKEY